MIVNNPSTQHFHIPLISRHTYYAPCAQLVGQIVRAVGPARAAMAVILGLLATARSHRGTESLVTLHQFHRIQSSKHVIECMNTQTCRLVIL